MNFFSPIQGTAGGNILPASFVRPSDTADRQLVQAVAGDRTIGVVAESLESSVGGIFGSQSYHATEGDPVQYYHLGSYALLRAGTGGWARGDLLTPDATGLGTPAVGDQWYGARAVTTVSGGEVGLVEVLGGYAVGLSQTLSASATLTSTAAGQVYYVGAADLVLVLPAPAAGFRASFVLQTAGLSAGTGLTVRPPANVKLKGQGFTAAAGKGALLAGATDREGDAIEIASDGTDYYATFVSGTWARES